MSRTLEAARTTGVMAPGITRVMLMCARLLSKKFCAAKLIFCSMKELERMRSHFCSFILSFFSH